MTPILKSFLLFSLWQQQQQLIAANIFDNYHFHWTPIERKSTTGDDHGTRDFLFDLNHENASFDFRKTNRQKKNSFCTPFKWDQPHPLVYRWKQFVLWLGWAHLNTPVRISTLNVKSFKPWIHPNDFTKLCAKEKSVLVTLKFLQI